MIFENINDINDGYDLIVADPPVAAVKRREEKRSPEQ